MESIVVWLLVGLAVVLGFVWVGYNKLIALVKDVENAHAQIDVVLDQRGKMFDSLAAVVKRALQHEVDVLTEVTRLRQAAQQAGSDAERFAAEESLTQIGSQFNLVMEAYPQIQANQNVMSLQEDIAHMESRLAYAKQGYNQSITDYETTRDSFPWNLIAGVFQSTRRSFTLWQVEAEKRTQLEAQRIDL